MDASLVLEDFSGPMLSIQREVIYFPYLLRKNENLR